MRTSPSLIIFLFVAITASSAAAGPAEDANTVIDRWSAAYSSNNPEAVARSYWPDAILLGNITPNMTEGVEAIRSYFSAIKGSGNQNLIGERRTTVISEGAAVITGFYVFNAMIEGKLVPRPSRFTMVVTKRGDEWRIANHHSSPRVQPN
jgi:uncharacterized protein (TIGR02246 family)